MVATVLQVPSLSCTGMLTVMTMQAKLSAYYKVEAKCMLCTLKRAHKTGLTVHFSYSLPLKVVVHI